MLRRLPPKNLIITSDDFGYSEERDDGIVQCFRHGAISCVSLMVNGLSVCSAVEKAAQIGMPMDLHLNLTEGLPVNMKTCNSLTDGDGRLLGKMGLRKAVVKGRIDMKDVEEEVQAQINKFCELTGKRPVKVDGHQHAHIIPGICEVFAKVLHVNGIKMSRLPIEEDISSHTWLSRQQEEFMESVVQHSRKAKEMFSKSGIWAPAFIGLKTMGKDMSPDHLQSCISTAFASLSKDRINKLASPCNSVSTCASKSTQAGFISSAKTDQFAAYSLVCELMVHPGKRTGNEGGCGNGPDDFSQSSDRELEMAVLMSKEMQDFYKNNNISHVAFQHCMETFI